MGQIMGIEIPPGYFQENPLDPKEMLDFFAANKKAYDKHMEQCCAKKCKVFLDGTKRRERAEVIAEVLEIIDKAQTYKMAVGSTDLFIDSEAFRDEVKALERDTE